MKKTYFQTKISLQIFVSIFFVFFIIFQYYATKLLISIIHCVSNSELENLLKLIFVFLVFEIMALLTLRICIRFEHINIHIKNDRIFMKDDWMRKKEKIQFKTEVLISEIKRIGIIWTHKNSQLKNIQGNSFGSKVPKAYLSFETMNGKTKNMLILYMNKRTVRQLITDIKALMIKNNNLSVLEDTEMLLEKLAFPEFRPKKEIVHKQETEIENEKSVKLKKITVSKEKIVVKKGRKDIIIPVNNIKYMTYSKRTLINYLFIFGLLVPPGYLLIRFNNEFNAKKQMVIKIKYMDLVKIPKNILSNIEIV